MHHICSIHSFVCGHLGFFHVLAVVNSAAANIGVHIYMHNKLRFSLGICPGVGFLGHKIVVFLVF